MAIPSALVFKVPELAQMGYALDQQTEKKRNAEEKEREQYAKSLGVDNKMLEGGFKLVGTWKEGSQLAFNQWKEANIEYQTTGSDESKNNLEAKTQQFNQIFGTGLGASTNASAEMSNHRSAGGKGYLAKPGEVDGLYKQFTTPAEFKVENGMIMVSDGDRGFVPATQSSYFATDTNPSNTFMLEKRNPEFVGYNPNAVGAQMARDIYTLNGVRVDNGKGVTYNTSEAANRVESEVKSQIANDSGYAEKIATWYFATSNGLNMGNLSMADMTDVQSQMNNSVFMEAAITSYISEAKEEVVRRRPSDQVPAPTQPGEPTQRENDAMSVLQTARAVKTTHKTRGGDAFGLEFSFANSQVKITGPETLYITNLVINDKGNIVGYDIYSGGVDLESMDFSAKNLYKKPLTTTQIQSLKAELRSRKVYDGMVRTAISEEASQLLDNMRRAQPASAKGVPTNSTSVGASPIGTPSTRSANRFGTRIGQ